VQYIVKPGFVPGMRVPGTFYVNEQLKHLLFEELQQSVQRGEVRHQWLVMHM
jgi:tRNA-splicing ligase RtcB